MPERKFWSSEESVGGFISSYISNSLIKGQVSGEIRGKTCTKLLYDLVFVTGVVQSGSKAAQRSRSGTGEGC
jgi:hypothetical protein